MFEMALVNRSKFVHKVTANYFIQYLSNHGLPSVQDHTCTPIYIEMYARPRQPIQLSSIT